MRTLRNGIVLFCMASASLVPGCSAAEEPVAAAEEPAAAAEESAAAEEIVVRAAPPAHRSCTEESDCGRGQACVAGACQPCSAHAQCQSDVCDRSAATKLGPGACVPEASVVYVDSRTRPACETGDGSRGNPVCEISAALDRVAGDRYTVRVYPGHYYPFAANDLTVSVLGPGDGSAVVGEEDIGVGAGVYGPGASVVFDGLDFRVSVLTGVVCEGASLKVLRGRAEGDINGIRATNCDLEVDQVRAAGLIRSGLKIAGTRYRISNSYFHGGDAPAVVFDGRSTGTFLFNTVTGGGEISPGGIDCGTTSRVIRDSIVVGSYPAAGGAQTVGACTHRRVVVGSGDTRPDTGLIKIDPDLDLDGRLLDTPANAACCIDRSARRVPGLDHDFFGTPRPQGARYDIGAHELR
jgi:hypothetical protein